MAGIEMIVTQHAPIAWRHIRCIGGLLDGQRATVIDPVQSITHGEPVGSRDHPRFETTYYEPRVINGETVFLSPDAVAEHERSMLHEAIAA